MCTKEMKRKEEEGKSTHLIGSVSLFLLHQRSACKGRQYETLKNYKQYCNDRNCERPAMAGALEGCHWEGELGVSWIEEVNPNKWWVLCGRGEHLLYLLVSLNPANWFIMTLGRVMYRKTLHRPINLQTEGCDLIDLRRLLFHVCQTRWDSSQPQMMTWKTRRPLWTSTCSTTHLALFGFISTISIQNANTLSSSEFLLRSSDDDDDDLPMWTLADSMAWCAFKPIFYKFLFNISKGTVCAVNDRPDHICLSTLVLALQLLHVRPACSSWHACPHSSILSQWVVGNYFSFHLVFGSSKHRCSTTVWLTDLRYLGEASEVTLFCVLIYNLMTATTNAFWLC